MAQVPDKVLQWLYSVLHEYHNANRTYTDVARALSAYPSLAPRTEVYTFESGSSALLLTLSGTLRVNFRGVTYHFPVKLCIPHTYPQHSPMVYVTPGREMMVRPGQHVDVQGRVYHPYLRDWPSAAGALGPGNLVDFLAVLSQVFEREPPVVSRPQQQAQQANTTGGIYGHQRPPAATPVPPHLPPKPGSVGPVEMPSVVTPPPKPPKPGEEYTERSSSLGATRDYIRDGPPLPPLPSQQNQDNQRGKQPAYQNGHATPPYPPNVSAPQAGYHPGRAAGPAIPPAPQQHPQQHYQRANQDRSPVSPVSPVAPRPEHRYAKAAPVPFQPQPQLQPLPQLQGQQPNQQIAQLATYASKQPGYQHNLHQQPQQRNALGHPQPQQYPPAQSFPQQRQQIPQLQQQAARKSLAPDLLTDPFDVSLPAQPTDNAPAPPIPPNPEKEYLLQAISTTLVQQVEQKVGQNLSAVAPLQAQQHALRQAHDRLQSEMAQLEHLTATIERNERILRESIAQCDRMITDAKRKPQPPIDDVLVPTTVVANQLWMLCAEESAIREAMYMLQKGLDCGRVSGPDFVKQMRALGREAFQKKALARKVATGLGLQDYG